MRTILLVLAALLAGCGSASPQEAFELGDEAQAEAERANSRVGDLEVEVQTLRQLIDEKDARIDDLEAMIADNAADDAANFRSLNGAIADLERQQHTHY